MASILRSLGLFTVSVETHFWASHRLRLPDGSREPLHHHNWAVTADVSNSELNSMGLIMDFRRLKGIIDDVVADFDNVELERLDYFRRNNSSAENVAKYVYERLEPELPEDVTLDQIRVLEHPGCSAIFAKSK